MAMLRETVLTLAVVFVEPAAAAAEVRDVPSLPATAKHDALDKASEVVTGAAVELPPWFHHRWLFGLEHWQWLGMPLMVLLALLLAALLGRLATRLLAHLAGRTESTVDDEVVARLSAPVRLLLFGAFGALGLRLLGLPEQAQAWGTHLFRVLLSLGFFWGVARAINTWTTRYIASDLAAQRPGSKALVNLVGRITQIAVVAFASLVALSELGFSVSSVLAGLGIGGIALALGAQKTLENLFGAFAIAVDQPIREGDLVKVEDVVGTVEAIGLRSTRLRTLDRTLVTVPNGKLADMRLETFAARDRFRFATTLGLTYGTSAAQLRQVRDGLEQVLKAHPKVWPDVITVRFAAFADSALTLEVSCWFAVATSLDFTLAREEVLLAFMEVVEKAGASFAFPTRTVHLVGGAPPRAS
jgi:MscS family membrane protein